MNADESEPFLVSGDAEFRRTPSRGSKAFTKRFIQFFSAFNVLILSANILLFVLHINGQRRATSFSTCYEHFPNEISGAVAEYEDIPQLFTKFQDSPFTGLPSESNDKAWHDLMENMVIRVTKNELAQGNQTSLPLPNGGFMAWLGVYHELHCIKMLRQFKYMDYYHPDTVPGSSQHAHLSVHADHCIEMLRQSAVCHADGSLTTFKWSSSASKPMLDLTRPPHECVNWDTLTESLRGRVVGPEETNQMINPAFDSRESEGGTIPSTKVNMQ